MAMEADLRKKPLSGEQKPLLRNGTGPRVPQKGKLFLPAPPLRRAATPPDAHGKPGPDYVAEHSLMAGSDSAGD